MPSQPVSPERRPGAPRRRRVLAVVAVGLLLGTAVVLHTGAPWSRAAAVEAAAAAPPPAIPVTVASVARREAMLWDAFSGRLEAVERVDLRARVAGAVQAVHFEEGQPVKAGDLLVSIDPAPFAAEVARAEAQVTAAEARLAQAGADLERGQKLWDSRTVSSRDLDTRANAEKEARANLRAAQAALKSAQIDLDHTEVHAPVSGRVGRREITAGNLVAGGPSAPVLTTLLSVDPIYASFDADESVVRHALDTVSTDGGVRVGLDRIPVEMTTIDGREKVVGRLQLIDNRVDPSSGTVRLRAVFANPTGRLMPGQFVRLRMGQGKAEPLLLVDERAVGTDQDKRFVMVVGDDGKAAFRLVTLGRAVDGLRIVESGLTPGERVIVNGLQRVRPGASVKAEEVAMGDRANPKLAARE
jgi:multidrug efflux system membrane fusion protein